jgi:hypothetical protein
VKSVAVPCVLSVHCAGLLDVQGASQNFLSADCRIRWQTEGHSCGDISESVSVAPLGVTEALYSAVFCVRMAHVRYTHYCKSVFRNLFLLAAHHEVSMTQHGTP